MHRRATVGAGAAKKQDRNPQSARPHGHAGRRAPREPERCVGLFALLYCTIYSLTVICVCDCISPGAVGKSARKSGATVLELGVEYGKRLTKC